MKNKINYKDLFELDDEIIYLNCSGMSPLLKSVKQAGLNGLEKRAKPWTMTNEDWFDKAETLRSLASRIFQTSQNNVAIIPSASYGLAAAAKNLQVKSGKSIVIVEDQFPSNYYIWENLAKKFGLSIIKVEKRSDKILTDSILESINSETGIVAVPNCHWVDGLLIDLERISEAVKGVGAFLILDLSQSLGVFPTNIDKIDPDFAVAVGYKWMLGSYGLSYMYAAPRWHSKGEPLEYNWSTRKGSEDFSSLINYTPEFREGARKFDMGESAQFNTMPMAIAALEQILKWEVHEIQSSLKTLTDIIYSNIKEEVNYNLTPRAGHIISAPIGEKNVEAIIQKISHNKIIVSFRGSFIRISPHLYNNSSDIDKLISCLS
ncbi:MAG: aminotransferase class V-fold PLP-dependent enzyme [Ignavibacteriaceae bacterium]